MGYPLQDWLARRFFGIVRVPVAGECVPSVFNPAAAEGVTHPESLRQKDRSGRTDQSALNTLESAGAVFSNQPAATEGAAAPGSHPTWKP